MNHCLFIINHAGRTRVIRQKRKNVHAYIRGFFSSLEGPEEINFIDKITYDPYKQPYFKTMNNNKEIKKARKIFFGENGVYLVG